MENNLNVYEAPQIEVIEVEVEKGFATSGDPTITNPGMGWGANDRRGEWGDFWE